MAIPELKPIEGKYEILEKLNEGGMGAVYKVQHRLLEEIRVIKVIRPQLQSDENLRRRFLREARAAVRLRHPNIAHLYDFTVAENGTAYMVIEFIDGVDLVHLIEQDSLPETGLVLDMSVQALRALSYLHAKQFVHRDISPDNLMLTKDVEGKPHIKLIDLGIAKPLKSEMNLTGEGLFLGKIRYASPEQFGGQSGDEEIDHRSDLYSFGIVLYELLTGIHPITGEDNQAVLAGHLFHPPRDFAKTDPENRVPDELRSITLKALEKSADNRFPDADTFSVALTRFASHWSGSTAADASLDSTVLHSDARAPVQRPGSTQERLDREFAPGTTPLPRHLEAVPSDDRVQKESRLQACCERIEARIAAKRLLEAEVELRHGESQEGSSILFDDLRTRINELREQSGQSALRAKLLLRDGDLDAALEEISSAQSVNLENPEIGSLLEEITKAIEHRDQRIKAARQAIEARLESGLLEEADQKLARAIEKIGSPSGFEDLQDRVASLLEAAEKVRGIAEEAHKVGELVERGELHQASAALAAAARVHGDDEMFAELADQIDALEARQREAEAVARKADRRRRIKSHLDLAEQHADAENFDGALEQLEHAAELDSDDPQLDALQARVQAVMHERSAGELLDRAYRNFDSGQLDTAAEGVEKALEISPGLAQATKLQRKILERRREEELLHQAEAARDVGASPLGALPRPLVYAAGVLVLLLGVLLVYLLRPGSDVGPAVDSSTQPGLQEPTETLDELLQGENIGKFYALIVGNNDYTSGLPNLDTAVNDAEQLAATLERRYGFETDLLLNATRYDTLSTLEGYIDRVGSADNLLVFYAGHGFVDEVTGRGYWQPTDAEPNNTSNWISSLEVLDILLDVPAQRVLVVADSCFSGAFADSASTALVAIGKETTPEQIVDRLDSRSRLVLTSGNLLPIVDNGGDGHSVFSRALLGALEEAPAAMDSAGLFERVSQDVSDATAGKELQQHPQFAPLDSDDGGVFLFVPTAIAAG